MPNPSITCWNRIEPRPRNESITPTLRAEVRDPLWFLTRQWQFGEFWGEDTGSPAFIELTTRSVPMRQWVAPDGGVVDLTQSKPLEAQVLAEPHGADFATRVELGQVFFRLLEMANAESGTPRDGPGLELIKEAFRTHAPLMPPQDDTGDFNPLDTSSRQFALGVNGIGADGAAIHDLARKDPPQFPAGLNQDDQNIILAAYGKLKDWVVDVLGALVPAEAPDPDVPVDAPAWDPGLLDHRLKVKAGPEPDPDTGAAPEAAFIMQPDADGDVEWSSFDVTSAPATLFDGVEPAVERLGPAHVRFPGMPAPRYWDFEEGHLSLSQIDMEKRDVNKMLFVDFILLAGIDWFVIPFRQRVGTLAKIDSLVVRDVFGVRTEIKRAEAMDAVAKMPGWTLFSVADANGKPADFHLLPPSPGPVAMRGPVLEEVRFARDEMANMAWAIEAAVESKIGEPRPGHERDAAVQPDKPETDLEPIAPLNYQVESLIPLHWIPLIAVPIENGGGAIRLHKGEVVRPLNKANLTVPSLGRVLNRKPYILQEEEIPRAGLKIERGALRSRWIDGSSHLWIARRRKAGAGETRSGLKFDQALHSQNRRGE